MNSESNPSGHPIEPVQGSEIVSRYSYYALSVLTLVNFLTYTELGAMEAALLLSFTILAPLFGRLGDRYSRTKLMAAAAVVWSIATGLTAWVDRWPMLPGALRLHLPFFGLIALSSVALGLCSVRALVGVGESSYSTITPTLIADYFPMQ